MLVKINANTYVLASDVVAIKTLENRASENHGKWIAVVKKKDSEWQYFIEESEVKTLVQDINSALKIVAKAE